MTNREKYLELMRKFAQELHDVGVTENMKGLISDQCEQYPEIISAKTGPQVVAKFVYRHNGYVIEAKNVVELSVKKCSP